MKKLLLFIPVLFFFSMVPAQSKDSSLRANYTKVERMIPMRDGVKLFTAIYIPKDASHAYPFLIERTPYSCDPYGEQSYPSRLTSNDRLEKGKYIFVFQDVRGRYMSEGSFEEATPHKPTKKSPIDTDESSDTFDTIDWLLKNIQNNNGKAGIYGISYPGFYASASLPDSHPALKAVSPQAPVTDEFAGDDVYHHGAFFLMDNFGFYGYFDHPRPIPWKEYPPVAEVHINDVSFYKKVEPLRNANDQFFKHESKIWNEIVEHNTYDEYWKARNIRTHLNNVKPAVLTVGGWFDAEDLFGALNTYRAIETQSPKTDSRMIMGPWTHGAWARKAWSSFAAYEFGNDTNVKFKELEASFFEFYLKDSGSFSAAEATVFMTGSNEWKEFTTWPPKNTEAISFYLTDSKKLSFAPATYASSQAQFISDPGNPVPYSPSQKPNRNNDYMGEDQRFAASRSDVLAYESEALNEDVTLAGPIEVNLFFSTTGTDADLIIKVIDVLPGENADTKSSGTQRMVRGDVLRGKFRFSLESPQAFTPGIPSEVNFTLNDICHTFKKGHKVMVQIQSSWFPLVDLNPQKFMNIAHAEPEDFQKATHAIHTGQKYPSRLVGLKLKK